MDTSASAMPWPLEALGSGSAMSAALTGALVGGILALIGGVVGGISLELWRARRSARAVARVLYVELRGNLIAYRTWAKAVDEGFTSVDEGTRRTMGAQVAIIGQLKQGNDRGAYLRAAAGFLSRYRVPVPPAQYETTAWNTHGAAFTMAAPLDAVGAVASAYLAIAHGAPAEATLSRAVAGVGVVAGVKEPSGAD